MININYNSSTSYSRLNKKLIKTSNIKYGTLLNNHNNLISKFKNEKDELNYYNDNIDILLNYNDNTCNNKNKLILEYNNINQLDMKNNKIITIKQLCHNNYDLVLNVNNQLV